MEGRKTYIVALGAILAALAGYLQGDLPLFEAMMLGVNALLAATLRSGMASNVEKTIDGVLRR